MGTVGSTYAVVNAGTLAVGGLGQGAEVLGGEDGRLCEASAVLDLVPPREGATVTALLTHDAHHDP